MSFKVLCVVLCMCVFNVACAGDVPGPVTDAPGIATDPKDGVVLNLTKEQIEGLAVEAAKSNDRRVYANGKAMSIKLIPPGGWDDSGSLYVLFEAISTTGWITQYIDNNNDGACDLSIDWQPVIVSEVLGDQQRHVVYFMMKDTGECPGGGGRL